MAFVNVLSRLPSIPMLRPMFNIGAGFDIPNGTYYLGEHGEAILNGGLPHTTGIVGPQNSFKSVIDMFMHLSVADRISAYLLSLYCTEESLTYRRVNGLARAFTNIGKIQHGDDRLDPELVRIVISSSVDILGDLYFRDILDIASDKSKLKLKKLTTPFFTPKGDVISVLPPTGVSIDSLSEFKTTANEENIVSKNNVGDSDNNTLYMRDGLAKKQLISQLPHMCAQGSMYVVMTAHVGEEFNIGGRMAPTKHKLTHSKRGTKITGASKTLEYLCKVIYEIFGAKLLNAEYPKGALYPLIESDRKGDCVDLLLIQLKLIRNKDGLSGASIDVVVSQREGVLPHLTQFHYIKENGFGLVGSKQFYSLVLVPEVKLSRTTVRGIINENPKIRRALEILGELLQIKHLWNNADELWCDPETLYNDLINMGYSWDILLNTRGFWVFKEEYPNNLPQLTTWDLLRMRKGWYTPYFLNDDKLTYNKKHKHLLSQ